MARLSSDNALDPPINMRIQAANPRLISPSDFLSDNSGAIHIKGEHLINTKSSIKQAQRATKLYSVFFCKNIVPGLYFSVNFKAFSRRSMKSITDPISVYVHDHLTIMTMLDLFSGLLSLENESLEPKFSVTCLDRPSCLEVHGLFTRLSSQDH